jgi:K+-transporting ATPase ATPase A chain
MLAFTFARSVVLYRLQRLQAVLPFNPRAMDAVSPDLAFNTSFITNTNWQSYTPESTMSYLVQMVGLTVYNFLSAATGIALAMALVRGFARRSVQTVGNFWVDMTRCTAADILHRCGIDERLRPHGRQLASGLGNLRRDGGALTRLPLRCRSAATWKARR